MKRAKVINYVGHNYAFSHLTTAWVFSQDILFALFDLLHVNKLFVN